MIASKSPSRLSAGCFAASALVAAALALSPPAAAADSARRVIKINASDAMKYSVEKIDAKAGEKLTISLTAQGSMAKTEMAHNWVLLAKTAKVDSFIMAASMARNTNYIPAAKKADVLAATGLAGAGETVTVDFTVPSEPGEYIFVCTFPAHYVGGMKGKLVVTK